MILTALILCLIRRFWTLDLQTELLMINNIGWFNKFSNSLTIAIYNTQGCI